jgi:hypothetical protein
MRFPLVEGITFNWGKAGFGDTNKQSSFERNRFKKD